MAAVGSNDTKEFEYIAQYAIEVYNKNRTEQLKYENVSKGQKDGNLYILTLNTTYGDKTKVCSAKVCVTSCDVN